jgi:preprotein translocase subunit YajC
MPSQQAPFIVQLIPMVLIFGIFYFLVIRPEKNKQKEHKNMVASLKKNDEVVTSGGIHGVVVNIKDTSIVLRLDENVRVEFDKEAVLILKKKAE